jgi:hypothetical protein
VASLRPRPPDVSGDLRRNRLVRSSPWRRGTFEVGL